MSSDGAGGEPTAGGGLTIGVPRETMVGERRVALVPETVGRLTKQGLAVLVETGAGEGAYFDDNAYRDAGAEIAPDGAELYRRADVVARVQPPTLEEVEQIHEGTLLISFLDPARQVEVRQRLANRSIAAFSFNTVPRITRAQSMDAMSAMSTVGGYKAVLLAADTLGRFFPLLMTAAGTVTPSHVFVIGAGVAGLQALATARRLGAITEAFDTRPAVREQVQSVGATFVEMPPLEAAEGEGGYAAQLAEEELERERDAIREAVARADVVITTALIPGKPAPLLINEEMVAAMRPGSVIIDMAAEAGGNCVLTVPGDVVIAQGVTVIGALNLPSSIPVHASQMYSRNVASVLGLLIKEGQLRLDPEDEIVRSACLTGLEIPT